MKTVDPYRFNRAWTPDKISDKIVGWYDASDTSTLYSDTDLSGQDITNAGVKSWQDVRGKYADDPSYGYLRIDPIDHGTTGSVTFPSSLNTNEANELTNSGDSINGKNGVSFRDGEGYNNTFVTAQDETSILSNNWTAGGNTASGPEQWQPYGNENDKYDAIGFHFALRTYSPIANQDPNILPNGWRSNLFQQYPTTVEDQQRIISHAPWTNNVFYFDAGEQTNMRLESRHYEDNPLPFEIDLIYSCYSKNTENINPAPVGTSRVDSEIYISVNGNSSSDYLRNEGVLGKHFTIGGDATRNYKNYPSYSKNTIGEIILTRGELSLEEKQYIEGYLAHKWNGDSTSFTDEFPLNHPWKFNAPTI